MFNFMNTKTIAIVSYLTIIGWVISFVNHSNSGERENFATFHLRQSSGIYLSSAAIQFASFILPSFIGRPLNIIAFIFLIVLWILGIMNASKESSKYLPFVGEFFDKNLNFIK